MEQIPKFQAPPYSTPEWLVDLNASAVSYGDIPLPHILEDSLFYPSARWDAKPIKHLGGAVFSFIYADYGVSREGFTRKLENPGFLGYSVLGTQDVTEQLCLREYTDINKDSFLDEAGGPFALWCVLERHDGPGGEHGPRRFSLLYLGMEGVAAYRFLFRKKEIAPRFLAIIQPGGEYAMMRGPLYREVIRRRTPQPECLLYGGWGQGREAWDHYRDTPFWSEYPTLLKFFPGYNKSFGVWRNLDLRPLKDNRSNPRADRVKKIKNNFMKIPRMTR